jgi:hypothetical protein
MINCIVEHLGKCVVPDFHHVARQRTDERKDKRLPDLVLFIFFKAEHLRLAHNRNKGVPRLSSRPSDFNRALSLQPFDVLIDALACDLVLGYGPIHNVRLLLDDALDQEVPEAFALWLHTFAHFVLTSFRWVNCQVLWGKLSSMEVAGRLLLACGPRLWRSQAWGSHPLDPLGSPHWRLRAKGPTRLLKGRPDRRNIGYYARFRRALASAKEVPE